SYGTSFRAPLITQIYGNSNNLFGQNYQNPAGGAPFVGFAYSGPNLDLKPEEATTWSLGADWSPASGVRFSVTYFNVEYTNQVDSYLADLAILNREAEFAGTGIILRGTEARDRVLELLAQGVTLARGTFPGGDPQNVTLYVDGRNNNLGVSNTEGIDFVASWVTDTDNAGTFTVDASGTYMTRFTSAVSPAGVEVDRLNTILIALKFKARGSVTWDLNPIRVQATAPHVGGYRNTAIIPEQKVSSYTPVDLAVSWTVGGNRSGLLGSELKLGFEVRNLFDQKPPYVDLAPSANGSGGYDARSEEHTSELQSREKLV